MKTWRKRVTSTTPVTTAVRSIIHVADAAKPQRVILLPGNRTLRAVASGSREFLRALEARAITAAAPDTGGPDVKLKILDSVHEGGAKLVEITAAEAQKLRAAQPGLIVVPEVFFQPAVQMYQVETLARPSATAAAGSKVVVKVVSQSNSQPVVGAQVVAFTNFAARQGAGARHSDGNDGLIRNVVVGLGLECGCHDFPLCRRVPLHDAIICSIRLHDAPAQECVLSHAF